MDSCGMKQKMADGGKFQWIPGGMKQKMADGGKFQIQVALV